MARNVLSAMKKNVEDYLDKVEMDLLGMESGKSTNSETGEISEFIRVEAEVPKGYGAFSRCQIGVKIPNGVMKLSAEERKNIEDADFSVTFKNLNISYIDAKSNVYFRADDYEIRKSDN